MNGKSHSNAFSYPFLKLVAISGCVIVILAILYEVFSRPTLTPEIGILFVKYDYIRSVSDSLVQFINFYDFWYRPFIYHFFNPIIFRIIDIHNIIVIKIVSMMMLIFNAFLITLLAKRIFGSNMVERLVIFCIVLSCPLYYQMTYDGSAINDVIPNIVINLCLLSYLTIIERSSFRESIADRSSQLLDIKGISVATFLCCLYLLIAITSHERALAIIPILFLTFFLFCKEVNFHELSSLNLAENKNIFRIFPIFIIIFCGIVAIWYLIFVYGSPIRTFAGGAYRTSINLEHFLQNIAKAFHYPFRMSFLDTGRDYDVHNNLLFNIFAVPFVGFLLFYLKLVFTQKDYQERRGVTLMIICFLSSLFIPVVFGGYHWHFFTAAMYISVLMGRSTYYYISKITKKVYLKSMMLIMTFIWISFSVFIGIRQEASKFDKREDPTKIFSMMNYMTLINQALKSRALNDLEFVPEVVFYDTGDLKHNIWAFGGHGRLFKYLFKNSSIKEIPVNNGKNLRTGRCKSLSGKEKTLYVSFDAEDMTWTRTEPKKYCKEFGK